MRNLITLRQNLNLSQKELAQKLDMTDKAYWSYESGRTQPNIQTLIKMADFFNVSLDYLCGRPNSNLIFTESLSPNKRELIKMIKTLSEDETLIAIGWIARLANKPIDEILKNVK